MEEINTEIKLFNVLKLKYRVEKSQKEVKIFGKEFITKFKNRYKIGYKNKILKLSEYFAIKNDDKDYLELELRIDAKEKIDATYMFDECSALIEITEISRKIYKHKPENQFHYDNNIYNKKDTDELDYWEEILLEKCQDSNIYKNIYDEEASIISENNTVDSGNSTNNIIWPNFNMTLIFTNMSCMFYNCKSLQYLPDLSNWSTKNVESMRYMFYNCSSLLSLEGISSWNTSNVKDMEGIFDNCSSLKSLPDISNWNTKKVTNMKYMFYNCSLLEYLPDFSNWTTTYVENMKYMFSKCSSLLSLKGLSKWNIQNVTNIKGMFSGCSSLKSLPDISGWNTSNVIFIT